MSTQNKKIILEFFKQFNEGNIAAAFEMVDDNVSWWVPGNLPFSGTKTKAQYLQIVKGIQSGFPSGFTLSVGEITAEDNRVAVEAGSSGIHLNGKHYNNKYHFLFHINNSKITAVKEYMDTQHLKDLIS